MSVTDGGPNPMVYPRRWIGPAPDPGRSLADFCAREAPPDASCPIGWA